MKKILVSLILASILAGPAIALAQPAPRSAPTADVMATLDSITDWLFAILLIIAAIFIIVAAYNFITASGDPEKTKLARNFVLYALIGVLVAFAAKGLVILVDRIVVY